MEQEREQEGAAGTPAAPEGAPQGELECLRRELEEQRARADRLLANWQRAQADLANLRKQVERERQEISRFVSAALILDLLPVLDDLERALAFVSDKLRGFTWVDGIHLIYRKFQAVLSAYGVQEIKAQGQRFDPHLHQAVDFVEGAEDGVVVQEIQKGYRLGDRVLRPSLVKVGRAPAPQKGETPSEKPQEGQAPAGV